MSKKSVGNPDCNTAEHYNYYISNIDKEIKRNYMIKECIIPYWHKQIIGKEVLELGGGPGYFGCHVKDYCNLTNTDISFSFLQEAKSRFGLKNIQANALFLPFKDYSFDTVIISGLLVYLRDYEINKIFREAKRILKDDGYILINEPSEYVRWYKTYLKLFRLDFLEPYATKVYTFIAELRRLNNSKKIPKTSLNLYIRNKQEYITMLRTNGFSEIKSRPLFVNIAPPSIEKYFFHFTYLITPLLAKFRKETTNGLLISAKNNQVNAEN